MSCYHKLETLNEPPYRYRCTLCGAKLKIASGHYPPKPAHDGNLISGLVSSVARAERLQGVQLPLVGKLAYRVKTANGSLLLCDRHLDLLRQREPAALTGESFPVELCDHCEDEMERGRR